MPNWRSSILSRRFGSGSEARSIFFSGGKRKMIYSKQTCWKRPLMVCSNFYLTTWTSVFHLKCSWSMVFFYVFSFLVVRSRLPIRQDTPLNVGIYIRTMPTEWVYPLKTSMEHKTHPIVKENHLNQTSIFGVLITTENLAYPLKMDGWKMIHFLFKLEKCLNFRGKNFPKFWITKHFRYLKWRYKTPI